MNELFTLGNLYVSDFLKDGGKFIVPCPKFEIIK
jgi:hypothetical protein